MLTFIILFGLGLAIAASYNTFADKGDTSEKLKRVQAKLAQKEALEKEQENMVQNTENEIQKED